MEVSQVSALLSPEMLKHDITMKKAVEVITSTAKLNNMTKIKFLLRLDFFFYKCFDY